MIFVLYFSVAKNNQVAFFIYLAFFLNHTFLSLLVQRINLELLSSFLPNLKNKYNIFDWEIYNEVDLHNQYQLFGLIFKYIRF